MTPIMRLTEKTRERLMLVHGCSMLLLGLALFYIRATMTSLFFYVFGGAFAFLLVAASLLFVAGIDWVCAAGVGRRQLSQLRGFLLMSTGVALCCVFLIFYPGATFQMLRFVLAAYALTMSVGKFELARSWKNSQGEQRVMYALAAMALAFAVCMVGVSGFGDRESLSMIAAYSLFLGLQMLLTMYFLKRQILRLKAEKHRLKQAAVWLVDESVR